MKLNVMESGLPSLAPDDCILALDLGRFTGVAEGAPRRDARPTSYRWCLSGPSDGLSEQCTELVRRLNRRFRSEPRVRFCATEAPLTMGGFGRLGAGEDAIRSAYAMAAIVAGLCGVYGIPHREVAVGRYTLHFLGASKQGGRAARKRAMIARCALLGYLPKNGGNSDEADALGLWDFACTYYARQPRVLALFGGGVDTGEKRAAP